jgi:hypothetical protein
MLQSVNIGVWYNETIHRIYHNHPQYRTGNFTEAKAFAKNTSGDAAFECSLLKPDRGKRRTIIDHQQAIHPEWINQAIIGKS